MTREELIKSDEYLIAAVECIVASRKSVRKMRQELNEFFLNWKAELLLDNQKQNSEQLPQLKQAVMGSAFVWGSWRDVEVIDESKLSELNLIRVMWRDDQNRRVTSFVLPNEVKKHCL